ncbi:MAG: BtpA/SgcQ family protein [Spirochaetia bacterium]
MNWIQEMFGTQKPVIAMCHLQALPGDPKYDRGGGIGKVIELARNDLSALTEGGVDAVMFSNEFSLPYLTEVEAITPITMARIIGELKSELQIPYGVNVLWDPRATMDLAVATDALFVREIFTGVYASDFGLWNTNYGEVSRHTERIGGSQVRKLFNIVPEAAAYLGTRTLADIAKSTVFNNSPDVLCVSGLTAGAETDSSVLRLVKDAVPDTPVFANTGVKVANIHEQLSIADGVVTATSFKRNGEFYNEVDVARVKEFMKAARETRLARV